jgi:hypothetical protein
MTILHIATFLVQVLRPKQTLLLLAFSSLVTLSTAEEPFRLYFIAVGSTIYLKPPSSDLHGFRELDGMNTSARLVADRLQRSGAIFGVLLTSNVDRRLAVGLPDIKAAIERIRSELQKVPVKDVLLVFYFAGHGISEGIAWNHFSVPGNLVFRGAIGDLSIDELALKTLRAASLVDDLEQLGVRYVVLLDNCYEGTETSFESPFLTGQAIKNLSDTSTTLKFINEFHQGNPVLFSTKPGTAVKPVKDPTDPHSVVGRLARRLVLTIDDAARSHGVVSLADFVHSMTSSTLDPVTSPAITNAEQDSIWSRPMILFGGSQGAVEERRGTAETLEVCGKAGKSTEESLNASGASKPMYGKIQILGSAGEYVTEGRNLQFSSPSAQFSVNDQNVGQVLIEVTAGLDSWEIELATADKHAFSPGRYDKAEKNGFADPGHPGMLITGAGRGCNDVAGSFVVKEVAYDSAGYLKKLSLDAVQYCDGGSPPLRMIIDLHYSP